MKNDRKKLKTLLAYITLLLIFLTVATFAMDGENVLIMTAKMFGFLAVFYLFLKFFVLILNNVSIISPSFF